MNEDPGKLIQQLDEAGLFSSADLIKKNIKGLFDGMIRKIIELKQRVEEIENKLNQPQQDNQKG